MHVTAFYVIRPSSELEALARNEFCAILPGPILWTKSIGGRTVWVREDDLLAVKLAFIAWLCGPASVGQSLKDRILGPPPYSAKSFDAWWSIECFHGADEVFEHVEREVRPEIWELFEETHRPLVDSWLDRRRAGDQTP